MLCTLATKVSANQKTKEKFNIESSLPEMFNSFCLIIGDLEECYINLLKMRLTIFENTKQLDFKAKVNIEKVLLSA